MPAAGGSTPSAPATPHRPVVAGATARHGEETPGAESDAARADVAWGVRARLEARRDFDGVRSRVFALDGLRHLARITS